MQPHIYEQNWQKALAKAQQKGLKIIEIGWEQHVIIDEKAGIIYRYPRHFAASAKLKDEVKVLKDINRHKWPVLLPVMLDHNDVRASYKYIPGEVLTEEIVDSLARKDLENIGRALGSFLALFHNLDSAIVLQKKTSHSTSLLEYYENRINAAKIGPRRTKALKTLSELKTYAGKAEKVVVHGDLHGPNVVIDPSTKQLVGIIDLSEIEIGDPHQEFRKVFMTFPGSLTAAINSYAESGGQKLNKKAIMLWAYTNEWANLCFFGGDNKNLTYQRALRHLKQWKQI